MAFPNSGLPAEPTYSYVELRPDANSAFDAERSWRDQAYRTWRCRCSEPKPEVRGAIDVVLANPKREMLVDFVFGFSGFAIAAVTLVELGWQHVLSSFHVGTVCGPGNKPVARYVTLRAKRGPVYIRGNERSPRRICPDCERLILAASGETYLCGIEGHERMLQSTFGNLLLRRDFFESTLGIIELPKVKLRRLDIRQSPRDGLPVSIDDAARVLKEIGK